MVAYDETERIIDHLRHRTSANCRGLESLGWERDHGSLGKAERRRAHELDRRQPVPALATIELVKERREGRDGLAPLCLGGGGSVAAAFERV